MVFQHLSAFLLFIPFIVFYIYSGKRDDFHIHFSSGSSSFLDKSCSFLYLCSLIFLITAISGPSFKTEKIRYLTPGENYFFILDVSPSMNVRDIDGMRRIDAAKEIISDFRETRANDYPGLILFSNEAVLSVPPSPDIKYFDNAVASADIVYPDKGTAVGDAAALAVFYLRKSVSDEKIAILISDGISNTGSFSPETAAEAAYENSIKIYTVSLGSDTDNTLDMMASETGALNFNGNSRNELEYAFSFIGSMEERERISEKVVELENFSREFILAAILCLFLSVFIKIFILREISL